VSASVLLDAVVATNHQVWVAGEADNLYGLAIAQGAVWAVGPYVDPATDNNDVLVLRGTGGSWTVDHAPDAGGTGFSDIPGGITAIDGQRWMAGMYTTATSNELPLIEYR